VSYILIRQYISASPGDYQTETTSVGIESQATPGRHLAPILTFDDLENVKGLAMEAYDMGGANRAWVLELDTWKVVFEWPDPNPQPVPVKP
jgi:hypothetical protein